MRTPESQKKRQPSRLRFRKVGVAVGVVLAAAGLLTAKGIRSYQHSRDEQRPPHGPVALPAELTGDGRLEPVIYVVPGGIEVHGWYLPSRTRAALLFVHGQPGTRKDLVAEAEALVSAGYGALLIDVPGHGESSGQPNWGESACNAVSGGVDLLTHRPDVDPRRIGAFGFSMGSSVVARAAIADRRISAVVLAGIFTNAAKQIKFEYRRWGPVSWWPALRAAQDEGLAFDWLTPEAFISRLAPTPVLFVAGTADTVVPQAMTEDIFQRAGAPKELLLVPGSDHGGYAATLGNVYFRHLRAFFDRNLGGEARADAHLERP